MIQTRLGSCLGDLTKASMQQWHMGNRSEGFFTASQGRQLFYQKWVYPESRGRLIITHGLSEHSDCYQLLAEGLSGIVDIFAWDLPGHGRSPGKRGYVDSFHQLSEDLAQFTKFVKGQKLSEENQGGVQIKPSRPIFLLGHSLGGLINLRTVIDYGHLGLCGLILSSPVLGLSVKVPIWKKNGAHLLAKLLPSATLFNEIRLEDLSRDEEIQKTYHTDPLRHDKISPRLYLETLENFKYVNQHADKLTLPILFQLAGCDRLVSLEASQNFASLLPANLVQQIIYPDSYHEIYNDLDRQQVYEDLQAYITRSIEKSAPGDFFPEAAALSSST